MATFPKLFSALNPWSKKVIFHESAPAEGSHEQPVTTTEFVDAKTEQEELNALMKAALDLKSPEASEKAKQQIDEKIALMTKHMTKVEVDNEGYVHVNFNDKDSERSIGLRNLVPTGIEKVKVVTKSGIVEGTRGAKGNFYTKEGKYLAIYSGDKFTFDGVQMPKVTVTNVTEHHEPEAAAEQKPAEAQKTAVELEKERIGRIKAAQELSYLREGIALNATDAFKLPEEFRGKSGEEISRMLSSSHMGDQLLSSMAKFSAIEGKNRAPIDLFEDIRTRNILSRNQIGVSEVTRVVLNKSEDEVRLEHTALSTKGNNRTPEETARWEQLHTFYIALGELKAVIAKLDFVETETAKKPVKTTEAVKTAETAPTQTPEEKQLAYFFDKNNDGPMAKVTAGEWLRSQKAHHISTGQTEGKVQVEKAMDARGMNYTEAAAWTKIMVKCSDSEGKLNQELLLKELNRLMQLGLKEAELTKSDYKGTSLPPLEMEGQNSMAYKLEHGSVNLPIYKALIQMGYSADLRAEQDKQDAAEKTPPTEGMDLSGFSPEDAEKIQKALHQEQVAYLGAMLNRKGDLKELGVGVSKRIGGTDLKPVNLTLGISNNVLTQQVTVGAGANVKVVKNDQFDLTIGGGLMINEKGPTIGLSANIDGTPIDKKQIYRLNFSTYAGFNPEALAFGIGAALGVTRDLQKVYEDKVRTEQAEGEKTAEAFLKAHPEYKESVASLKKNLDQIAAARGIDDMGQIQFISAGVGCTFVPPNLFIPYPYLNIAIKGKPFVVYEAASKVSSDERVIKAIEAERQKSTTESITMYDSGPMMETADGSFKVGSADVPLEKSGRVDAINAALKDKNLKVEIAPNGLTKLIVLKAIGETRIIPDPTSKIEVSTDTEGNVYLNIDDTDSLSVLRNDNFSSHLKGNAYQNTEIYIGKSGMDVRSVMENHTKYVLMTGGKGKIITGKMSEDEGANKAVDTVTSLKEKGELTSLIPADWEARQIAMQKILENVSTGEKNNEAPNKADIEAAVKTLIEKDTDRKLYKRLSTEMDSAGIVELIDSYNATVDPTKQIDTNSSAQLTYFLQKMMEASLSTLDKGNPEAVKERAQWNVRPMTKMLMDNGFDQASAEKLAKEFMGSVEVGKETTIDKGSTVYIAVGTEGIKGTRSSQWTGEGKLLGAKDVNSLDPKAKETFQASLLKEMHDDPYNSRLALQLLPAADLLFSAEELKDLGAERKEGPAYDKFMKILETLYTGGTYTEGALSITPKIDWKVGLYEKCCNFTEVYSTDLKIQYSGVEASKVETDTVLTTHPEVKFFGVGGAVSINARTGTPPEPEVPDDASKISAADVDGGLRPTIGSGRNPLTGLEHGTGAESGAVQTE